MRTLIPGGSVALGVGSTIGISITAVTFTGASGQAPFCSTSSVLLSSNAYGSFKEKSPLTFGKISSVTTTVTSSKHSGAAGGGVCGGGDELIVCRRRPAGGGTGGRKGGGEGGGGEGEYPTYMYVQEPSLAV